MSQFNLLSQKETQIYENSPTEKEKNYILNDCVCDVCKIVIYDKIHFICDTCIEYEDIPYTICHIN